MTQQSTSIANSFALTEQAIQNLILAYLEDNPQFLTVIQKRFPLPQLEMVDEETETHIGQALVEHQAGQGIRIKTEAELIAFLVSVED